MKPIDIDFGAGGISVHRMGGLLALGVTAIAVGFQVSTYWDLRAETERWQAERHRFNRMATKSSASDTPEQRDRLYAELRLANQIIDKLEMPWDALFAAIEANIKDDVVLLRIEPDTEQREIRLTGEAKNTTLVLDYVRALRHEPALSNARLTGHQIDTQDGQRLVRFTVEAGWAETLLVRDAEAHLPVKESKL